MNKHRPTYCEEPRKDDSQSTRTLCQRGGHAAIQFTLQTATLAKTRVGVVI